MAARIDDKQTRDMTDDGVAGANPLLGNELERLRAYFEGASSAVFVYDADGALVDLNPAACRLHGYTREEMFDLGPARFIAPESLDTFAEFRDTVLAGKIYRGEARGLKSDGSRCDVEVEGKLIEIGGRQYLFSSLIDVTERKALAEQLRHAQRMEAIGRLAGGVAHDFNNLLSVILGYTELLSTDIDDEGKRQDLDAIMNAGHRARELVQRLLAFSRRQTLDVESTELNGFVEQQVLTLRRVLPENIAVRFEPARLSKQVRVDRAQTEQILLNLAINAQHAMPDGGSLTFAVELVTIADSDLGLEAGVRQGDYMRISVADTGKGMDTTIQSRIFEPFFTTKDRGEGTGLGLAMVYGSIKQHGGYILVDSAPGAGARFDIYLPIADEDEPVRESLDGSGRSLRGTEHVLVVEDNADVRDLATRMLRDLGYVVYTAGTGTEAIEVARQLTRLDLLVSDVVLPETNGREIFVSLERIRPGLRVVYMSGYSEDVISVRGLLEPGVRLVPKPFSITELGTAVRDMLDVAAPL